MKILRKRKNLFNMKLRNKILERYMNKLLNY